MKYLVVSDIHGSLYYTKFIINHFNKNNFDYLILLGDFLYHGARNNLTLDYNPKEVTLLLNSYKDKIIAIRGNCDSRVDEMVLDFPLSDNSYLIINDKLFFLTHGDIYNEFNLPNINKDCILMYGHYHIPFIKKVNDITIINPGSISLPKNNTKNSFIEIIDNKLTIKDIDKNIIDELIF